MARLILASSSAYRRELLSRLGVEFTTLPADVDETRLPDEPPMEVARRLACAKAKAVSVKFPEAFVLGSDQVIAVAGEILHKPVTAERAAAQLELLSGRAHSLFTGVCIIAPGGEVAQEVSAHEMVMRSLSASEIEAYVVADTPLDCAGSYRIEAAGIGLFESLRGDDYTGIVGLPLTVVRRLLDTLGYDWDVR